MVCLTGQTTSHTLGGASVSHPHHGDPTGIKSFSVVHLISLVIHKPRNSGVLQKRFQQLPHHVVKAPQARYWRQDEYPHLARSSSDKNWGATGLPIIRDLTCSKSLSVRPHRRAASKEKSASRNVSCVSSSEGPGFCTTHTQVRKVSSA